MKTQLAAKKAMTYTATSLAVALPLAWSANLDGWSATATESPTNTTSDLTLAATTTPLPPKPAPKPGNPTVREAQQRLAWAGLHTGTIDGLSGPATIGSVKRFQGKYLLAVDGKVGPKTLGKLRAITAKNSSAVDRRCLARGRFLCADKTQRILRHYYNGKLIGVADARFGRPGMETTNGAWKITWKSRDHKSKTYDDASMPFAMFFYRGEAVHYSSDFAALGYRYPYGSHGCINLRDRKFAEQLFNVTPVNAVVVVYNSL